MTAAYKEPSPAQIAHAGQWKPAHPEDAALRGKWWEIFGDPQLNKLEDQLTDANQDLKAAAARFQEARAQVGYQFAAEFPTISTAPQIDSLKFSSNRPLPPPRPNNPTGDFLLPVDLSYEIDLWGRVRRTVAAAGAEAQASAADLQTANLSLHAELAIDYIELRAADAQIKLLNDTVKAYSEALQLTQSRLEGGAAAESDVAQAKTQLETTRVQATDAGVQRAQYEHAIAVLIGVPPAAFGLPPAPLDLQPPVVPAGVPSDLLQRRPDIAAAERRMAEANEQIGIAQAAYYPTVSLRGLSGFEGSSLYNWFDWPSLFWGVGLTMTETVFDAGRRRSQSAAALATYDEMVATYRQTTLAAFQDVENNLSALHILEREAAQQSEADAAAQNSLRIFTNRYVGGNDTYLNVIVAQTATLSNQRNTVDIQRRRMDAAVLLVKALGGGWDVATLPSLSDLHDPLL